MYSIRLLLVETLAAGYPSKVWTNVPGQNQPANNFQKVPLGRWLIGLARSGKRNNPPSEKR
jgi:hypothetical protein